MKTFFSAASRTNFFMREGQLIENIKKINHLPLIIVNGRYDLITRASSAYKLHRLWPSSELILVDSAGHSSLEPQIALELMNSTEKMKKLLG